MVISNKKHSIPRAHSKPIEFGLEFSRLKTLFLQLVIQGKFLLSYMRFLAPMQCFQWIRKAQRNQSIPEIVVAICKNLP